MHQTAVNTCLPPDIPWRTVLGKSPSGCQRYGSQTDFLASIRQAGHCTRLDQEQTQELVELFEQLAAPENSRFGSDIERVRRQMHHVPLVSIVCDALVKRRFSHQQQGAAVQRVQVFTSFETIGREEGMFSPEFARVAPILEYIQQHIASPTSSRVPQCSG
mgnify:CR=1 FL=1